MYYKATVRTVLHALNRFSFNSFFILSFITLLSACGGGGGGGGDEAPQPQPQPQSVLLSGMVSANQPISDAVVTARGVNGELVEATTDSSGQYSMDVADLSGPYLLKVTVGNQTLYGIAFKEGVANINALSNLVVANFFSTQNEELESVFSSNRSLNNAPSENQIAEINAAFQNLLVTVLQQYQINQAFNFLFSNFSTNLEQVIALLQQLVVNIDGNALNLYVVDASTNLNFNIIVDGSLNSDFTETDTTPPSEVSDVTVTAAGQTDIAVTWGQATDNVGVAGYNIYLDGAEAPLATVAVPMFSHMSLQPATTYCYEVEAFDGENNRSPKSISVCDTTSAEVDVTPPMSVTDLTAETVTSNSIELVWNPSPEEDVVGYKVSRKSGETFEEYKTVTTARFLDESLDASTEYCYQVQAFDAANNLSINSNPFCATTEDAVIFDVEAPMTTASLAAGEYESAQSLELTCDDNGGTGCAATYYTTDGSEPVNTSTEYSGPIAIEESQTVKVYSEDNAGNAEAVQTFEYVISIPLELDAPVTSASPAGGSYEGSVMVQLGCSDGEGSGCAATYYTTDGSLPTVDSDVYSSAILISADTTLSFFSVDVNGNQEAVMTESYLISTPSGYSLSVTSNDASGVVTSDLGSIDCGAVCSDYYSANAQVTLTAEHPSGLTAAWTGCADIGENQCLATISGDINVSVSFLDAVVETELNDAFTDADLIVGSSEITGFFNSGDDRDYYQFEVTETGTFYASVSHESVRSYLRLYDVNKTEITSSGYGKVHKLSRSLNPGIYYLRVAPVFSEFDLENAYSLTVTGTVLGSVGLDMYEENNSFSNASTISESGIYEAHFDTENDADYFRFEVTSTGTFYAGVAHERVRSYLRLYDANKTEITSSGYGKSHKLSHSLNPGTYYLRAKPVFSEYDANISYTLEISGSVMGDVGSDEFEQNNSFSTASVISESGVYEANFDTENDADYYRFEVTETGTFYAGIAHERVRSYLRLYDANKTEITSSGYGKAHKLSRSLIPGVYYLRAKPVFSEYDANISYTLDISGSVMGDVGSDGFEQNNSFSTASVISESGVYEANFDTENDADYYRFEVTETGTFYAGIAHERVRSYLRLYDANKTEITSSGYGKAHKLSRSLNPGTYYLRAKPVFSEYDANISYTLEISGSVLGDVGLDEFEQNNSFATASVISGSGIYEAHLDTENDADYFKFEVTEAGTFYAGIAHERVRSYLRLYDANKTELTSSGYGKAHSLSQPLQKGVFYLRATPAFSEYDPNIAYNLELNLTQE